MMRQACIGEPISWLRLETFALDGQRDASMRDHVAACPACKQCLEEIERDVVALPPLSVPEKKTRRPWWQLAIPAGLAIAAAAILLLVIRPRPEQRPENFVSVKGIGYMIDVVRDRDGEIRDDVRTFREGDRFKVVITCPPGKIAHFELGVSEHGSTHVDNPLAPAELACGNHIVMPGAFTITGTATNHVCVQINY